MKYFQTLFQEKKADKIEHNGTIYYRFYPVVIKDLTLLKFRFVESKSKFIQAIVMCFPYGFNGNVFLMGEKIPIKNTAFPMLNFWEDTAPKEFEIFISNFCGEIKVCNGSDPIGTKQICKNMSEGCAMITQVIDANKFRFYCNDHDFDGDCNNLVFELEIQYESHN